MQQEVIILNQKEKDKYHMVSLIHGISNMAQMNLPTKQKASPMAQWVKNLPANKTQT